MPNNPAIPLIIMEEHHEAFFVWHYGYFKGFIRPFGNTLLHVDSHSDFDACLTRASIDLLEDDLKSIYDFGYRELGIASFIIPAIYRGIINNFVFLCRYDDYQGKISNCFANSYHGEGRMICTDAVNTQMRARIESAEYQWGNHQFFTFQKLGVASRFKTGQPLILDIDLDFFSCDNSTSAAEIRIEITKAAYQQYISDKYHPFRILPAMEYEVTREDGRFYLRALKELETGDPKKVSTEVIDKRIELFIDFMKSNGLKPGLIDICRSRYSGYTPEDQWQYIENKLLEGLGSLYDLSISHISQFEAIYGSVEEKEDDVG